MPEIAAQTMSWPYSSKSAWPQALTAARRFCASRKKRTSSTGPALPLRERDLGDLDFGERLAVAVGLANALFRLIAEDEDLLVFGLAQNGSGNGSSAQGGAADRDVVAVGGEDDLVEGNVGANLARDQIAADDVALGDSVLLAAGFDDRVHDFGTIAGSAAAVNGAWRAMTRMLRRRTRPPSRLGSYRGGCRQDRRTLRSRCARSRRRKGEFPGG